MGQVILVVEDEPGIAENISYALETEGFEVHCCATLGEANEQLPSVRPNLIVLDINLPDGNGFDFCRELRKSSSVPVIFLTARKEEVDRVVGLEIGGDDYMVKPFSPRELGARIKAVLRRVPVAKSAAEPESSVESGAFAVDEQRKRILYYGQGLDLSRYEYRLLCVLVRRPGRVFSRDELLNMAWEEPEASMDRTVDAHVKKIRAKLREVKPGVEAIRTHRGMGYSLSEDL
jgi:two-component system catabolic regulation response regulator CreB